MPEGCGFLLMSIRKLSFSGGAGVVALCAAAVAILGATVFLASCGSRGEAEDGNPKSEPGKATVKVDTSKSMVELSQSQLNAIKIGPVGMYAGIVAIRYASASSLGPYTFLRLVIASVAGSALFNEIPDRLSWLGIATILLSCVLAVQPAPREADSRAA